MSLVNAADVVSQILMFDRRKGNSETMKNLIYMIVASIVLCARVQAGSVLFDFNDPSLRHAPLPIDLTVSGLTAHLSGTGDNFSIQQLGTDTGGVIPAGFTGNAVYPSGINTGDLLVGFSKTLTDFSIMVAPDELNTDSTATLRVTAFMNGVEVGTNTSMGSPPFFWPSSTLSFSSPQGFNSVVVHYDSPPPTGGDFVPIFMADNMIVTVQSAVVPEPSSLTLLGIGVLGLLTIPRLRRLV
jgi:hypothetical protein